jgi:hypothetical protein
MSPWVDNNDGGTPGRELVLHGAAGFIRVNSKAGKLVTGKDILQDLLSRRLLKGDEDEAQGLCKAMIESALEENEDLTRLPMSGTDDYFFSSRFMSEAYAKILVQKDSDPLLLIAETVRQNSAVYPRPVPLNAFEETPFDLTREEVQGYLSDLMSRDEYRDIKETRTSIGTIFLYSTLHLEPGHASMLAEWVDVGQADNP